MALVALVAWLCTVSIGLYLLAIWLIEYDREFQSAAATRLPVLVIGTHGLLAFGGLAVWAIYLITDAEKLAWVAAATLGVVVTLGLIMAARWIGVRRAHGPSQAVAVLVGGRPGSGVSRGPGAAGAPLSSPGRHHPRRLCRGYDPPGAADRARYRRQLTASLAWGRYGTLSAGRARPA
jgi:hypothetical protein